MSDYQKGSNAPFMEETVMDAEKSKDYLEVVKKPLWLKKSELALNPHFVRFRITLFSVNAK